MNSDFLVLPFEKGACFAKRFQIIVSSIVLFAKSHAARVGQMNDHLFKSCCLHGNAAVILINPFRPKLCSMESGI